MIWGEIITDCARCHKAVPTNDNRRWFEPPKGWIQISLRVGTYGFCSRDCFNTWDEQRLR